MNTKVIYIIILASLGLSSGGHTSDVFTEYERTGTMLISNLEQLPNKGEEAQSNLATLVHLGYQIMNLAVSKYPECRDQFIQCKSLDHEMKTSSFDFLETKFHDGEGLIPAPVHCYQPRSMVVHPNMARALLREGKQGASSEIEEVVRRAPKLRTRLSR